MSARPRRTARIRVADPAIWEELSALLPLHAAVVAELSPREREVDAGIEGKLRRAMEGAGRPLLRRRPELDPPPPEPADPGLEATLRALPPEALALLHRVQRRAQEGFVTGATAWDPHAEARLLAQLVAAGLVQPLTGQADPAGPWQLRPSLPPPPPIAYHFEEALFDPPEDLPPDPSPRGTLDADIASVAAALRVHPLRVTHALTPDVASARGLGRRLADPGLARTGRLEAGDPRWRRALEAMRVLRVLGVDEISRELRLLPELSAALRLDTPERLDRLLRRAVDPALTPLLPAVRAALAQAGGQAIDVVIFQDLLADQHRDVLFSPRGQVGLRTYPPVSEDALVFYNRAGFDEVEGAALASLLRALGRLGFVRAIPGVFAATADGRAWAAPPAGPRPPIHLTPDLHLLVPPGALSARERMLLETLAQPTQRDVVDQLVFRRADLVRWLEHHTLDEALALLESRAAHGVPMGVRQALSGWAEAAERVIWLEPA